MQSGPKPGPKHIFERIDEQMSASASKKKRKELEEQGLSASAVAAQKEKERKSTTKSIFSKNQRLLRRGGLFLRAQLPQQDLDGAVLLFRDHQHADRTVVR